MQKILAFAISLMLTSNVWAADNAVVVTTGSGLTLRSRDVGAGVQSLQQILGDTSGAALATAPGTPNSVFALPIQGVTGGTAVPVSLTSTTITGTVAATQSGTWNITNVSGTISLPTGAATSALQTTGNTSLTTINTTLGTPMQNSGGSVTANAGTNLNTSLLSTKANQDTNSATTAHTCSTAGFSELGCLGQIDDDIKGAPFVLSHASVTALGTSLVVKASAGSLSGFNCTAITGGAAGYCIAYNATSAPGTGALTGSLVLDSCYYDTTARGCSLAHVSGTIAFSTGIVVLMTSAVTPFTYTTGTNTGYISGDYN